VTGHVIDAMTVQRVPEGDDAETDQPERHGPFHGATCPIAGLAHSYDLAGVGEGLFDSPPCGITGYQIFCGRFQIGGHQGESIPAIVAVASARLIVAHQDHPVRLRNEPYHRQVISVICTASVRP
jgi:hypothetical protein